MRFVEGHVWTHRKEAGLYKQNISALNPKSRNTKLYVAKGANNKRAASAAAVAVA